MGVGGHFWDLLKPYARAEGFDFLRDKRVAVDLSFWIIQHQTAIKAHARKPHLRLTFFRTINLFSKFGAYPVFVADGTPSPLKSHARISRFFRFSGIELKDFPVDEDSVPVERNREFSRHVQECLELVELLGMPVLYAKGEAEALCAQLNSEGYVDACITSDSDAFLYGAKCVIKSFCSNAKEAFECYNIEDIEAGLGLKRRHLIVSLLVGNDYDLNGVRGIGLDTALRFVRCFGEEDVLNRLQDIGNGKVSSAPTNIKSAENCVDMEGNFPSRKQLHCSFCGHPGSKRDHMKSSCEFCITSDDEGCLRKPEGFTCGCPSCDMVSKRKGQRRRENWYTKICLKIAQELKFPRDEIIEMYLCKDSGCLPASDDPCISWGKPKIEMLIDFLNFHQHWDPSYIRRQLFPMMSTIFLRDMANAPVESLVLGTFELDSIQRVKIRYGYQSYVVKWKCAVGNVSCTVPSHDSSMQQADGSEHDEFVDLLDDSSISDMGDGCSFLLTDENMDLVRAAFPAKVERFWQEQELKGSKIRKASTPRSLEKESSSLKTSSIQQSITKFYRSVKTQDHSNRKLHLIALMTLTVGP
ncbi:flap endonuclease GEN-like 1 [Neltuma alba]|uniref:flap endonuclease GEN-like 1 n=1 Tax=Neltuma alba TaxID=207710 RepID=UPI0010A2FB18|nr:flap endonuclease GEN-like 1 [Prosopis alba]